MALSIQPGYNLDERRGGRGERRKSGKRNVEGREGWDGMGWDGMERMHSSTLFFDTSNQNSTFLQEQHWTRGGDCGREREREKEGYSGTLQ